MSDKLKYSEEEIEAAIGVNPFNEAAKKTESEQKASIDSRFSEAINSMKSILGNMRDPKEKALFLEALEKVLDKF